jgi:uncharacterized protein YjbJ (UPF0337 family)
MSRLAGMNEGPKTTPPGALAFRNDRNLDGCGTLTPHNPKMEMVMDWNRVEGNWKQMKGKIKEKWGKLTDDDLDVVAGHRDQLEGKIQERYGIARDQIRKDVDDWYNAQRW